MATKWKRPERQAKGKKKIKKQSPRFIRTSRGTGTDLGASLLFLTQTLHCAARSLLPRTLVFELSADDGLGTRERQINVLQ